MIVLRRVLLPGLLALAPMAAHADPPPLASASDPAAIIGGAPVSSCDWPSTVFLENCTGTLIHPEIVVYAAHCGDDRERAWFGEDISSGQAPDGEGFSVDVEYCMVNPDYATEIDIGPVRAADFGFCKLATPVLDVPIVPPLVGCETTILTPGTDVTLVGYGGTDQQTFGVKFSVDTVLHYIDDWGAAVIGGGGQSPCAGDSGGPAFVQLPDGTWRAFGIVSGPNVGNCGDAMWFATIHTAIPFIEANSGIDVSACHYGESGGWNPSPACGEFPLEPQDGSRTSWASDCAGGPTLPWSTTCGPAFDGSEDLVGPVASITAPEDRARFDTDDDADTYPLTVTAAVADLPSGVQTVTLVINDEPVEGSLRLGAPWQWDLAIPPGVWEIAVVATDWAGNEASSEAIVIGIDEDPPEKPEPSTSSGAADESSSTTANGSTGDASAGESTTTSTTGGGTSSGTSGEPGATSEGGGCGCRATGTRDGWALALLLGLVWRRRRAAVATVVLAACSNEPAGAQDTGSTGADTTTSTSTSSTSVDPTTPGTSSEGSSTSSEGSSGDTSTGPACEIGTERCGCTDAFTCDEGLTCSLDTCVPCDGGSFGCPCDVDDEGLGTCDEGLYCFGGLCAAPQPCPYLEDGDCDEPVVCLKGTDDFDCCATEPGVCEERSRGGACPDGSDPDDCGGESSSSGGGSETTDGSTSDGSTSDGSTSSGTAT